MRSIINELWHGNIVPQEDSRNNTKEMKELISYIARHDEDLDKLYGIYRNAELSEEKSRLANRSFRQSSRLCEFSAILFPP